MISFQSLWKNACGEAFPNPQGAAGELVAGLGELLKVEQVGYARVGRVAMFLFDLSPLGFKDMDLNVLMVSQPPHDEKEWRLQTDLLHDYRTAVRSDGFCFQIFLSPELPKSEWLDSEDLSAVSICGADLERMFAAKVPESVVFEVIRRQLPLQHLCPFNTTHVARGSMFRGRKLELDHLTRDLDTQFVVSGARRIGKSSVLARAYDKLWVRPEYRERVFHFNCITWGDIDDCFHRLAHGIDPRKELRIQFGSRNVTYMLERSSHRGTRPLLLFFDELDRVVEHDAAGGWRFFKVLAEAVEARWVRLVCAGYRSMALLAYGKGSPFYGSLKDLPLSPLSREECSQLIAEPVRRVEIQIKQREAVLERVWKVTAGHPFLVQFYGEKLFQRGSQRNLQEIGPGDLEEIEGEYEIHDFLVTHLLENTIEQGQPVEIERLCAFLYAHESQGRSWVEGDFLLRCKEHGRPFPPDDVHRALRNLWHASILAFSAGQYSFTFPMLGDVLRKAYPDFSMFLR